MKASQLQNLSVAIIGGGYGGATAALALANIGIKDITVYEQATQFAQVGAAIGLRPTSMDLFRQWGVFDTIDKVSVRSNLLNILSADGNGVLAEEEWPGLNDYGQLTHCHLIHRADFIDALLEVLPEGTIKTGHRLVDLVDNGENATLTFENGVVATADLVIGADGIRSVVRKKLFSDAEPVFSGEHAYRAVLPTEKSLGLDPDNNPRFYMGRNGTVVYNLPLPNRREFSYDITAKSADGSWAPEITNEDLVRTVEGFDERIVEIARTIDVSTMTCRAVFDIDPVENWHTDSVTLLGDAAHAMLHHQGQGANSAIQDGGALADALLAAPTVGEALTAFQAVRKPVTDELQRISRGGWEPEEVESAFPGQK